MNGSQPLDDNRYQLLWELLQEFREINGYLGRIANYFDPPKAEQPDLSAAIRGLEAKIDGIANGNERDEPVKRKEWYTTKEAADLLPDYTAGTLRQACNLGRIPDAKKVGREWRIPLAAINRIANEGLPSPAPE